MPSPDVRLILLGAPGIGGEAFERWHDDVVDGARELGWTVDFLRVRDVPADDIVRAAKGADMLLWLRTHSHNLRGDGWAMLRRIEDAGVRTAGLHMDLCWGIQARERRVGNEPWWSAQHVFTADGGNQDRFAQRGVHHHWCPPPFGSRYLGYGTPDPRNRYAAAFVGSCVRSIHGPHRAQLISWAKRRWGHDFVHVGGNSRTRMYHRKLNNLYASTTVVLGDSAPAPYYWSDRLPRTLGRGALMAYTRTAGLDEWGFDDQVMIRYERGQFRQIVDRLAGMDAAARRAMTDAAITLVSERHLWRHRLAWIAGKVMA